MRARVTARRKERAPARPIADTGQRWATSTSPACGTRCPTAGCCWTTYLPVGEGARAGAGRRERRRQDDAAADHRRRPRPRSADAIGPRRRPRRDAPVHRLGARRHDGAASSSVDLAPPPSAPRGTDVQAAELALMETDDERTQMAYAHALAHWGDVGGYDAEVTWDTVTVAALGVPYDRCKYRELSTLSGGEQKRLALEALLRGPDEVLLLDEPDNYLDVPGQAVARGAAAARRRRPCCSSATTASCSPGSPTGSSPSRAARPGCTAAGSRPTTRRGRPGTSGWPSCGGGGTRSTQRLIDLVRTLQQQAQDQPGHGLAVPRDADPAGEVRGRRAAAGPARGAEGVDAAARRPHRRARGHLRGAGADRADAARSTPRSSTATGSACSARTAPASRTSCGCSAGEPVAHTGEWRLGARVVPGLFAQTHAHPEWLDRTPVDLLWHGEPRPARRRPRPGDGARCAGTGSPSRATSCSGRCPAASRRGSRSCCSSSPARRCCCSTSRPTTSTCSRAEALEEALDAFDGTVLAVTHDRWFAAVVRPVPGLRRRRPGVRVGRAGVRRDAGARAR